MSSATSASRNGSPATASDGRIALKLVAGPEAVAAMAEALGDLDLHRSYFQRKAAFEALCRKTGMTLDPG